MSSRPGVWNQHTLITCGAGLAVSSLLPGAWHYGLNMVRGLFPASHKSMTLATQRPTGGSLPRYLYVPHWESADSKGDLFKLVFHLRSLSSFCIFLPLVFLPILSLTSCRQCPIATSHGHAQLKYTQRDTLATRRTGRRGKYMIFIGLCYN